MICEIELSKALKEVGFDYPSDYYYNSDKKIMFLSRVYNESISEDECVIPTIYQAAEWLRDVHNLHVNPVHTTFKQLYGYKITTAYNADNGGLLKQELAKFEEHNEALHSGLIEAVNILKQKV